jgi:hypothetical protein
MTDINALIPAHVQAQVNGEVAALLTTAKIETITTVQQRENCDHLCIAVKRMASDMEGQRKTLKQPHLEAGQAVDDYFREPIAKLKALADGLNKSMYAFDEAERRRIAEAQRIADEAAAAERKRLADIEDARLREEQRLRDEAAAKMEAAQKETDAAKRDQLTMEANTAIEVADIAATEAIDAARAGSEVKETVVLPSYTRPKGQTVKKVYKAEVTDKKAFIDACVRAGKYHWLTVDESLLNKAAAAEGLHWVFPGTRVVEETQFSNRTRRAG